MQERLYKPAELAELAGVTRQTIYTWLRENKLRGTKIGRQCVRISELDWLVFLREREYEKERKNNAK